MKNNSFVQMTEVTETETITFLHIIKEMISYVKVAVNEEVYSGQLPYQTLIEEQEISLMGLTSKSKLNVILMKDFDDSFHAEILNDENYSLSLPPYQKISNKELEQLANFDKKIERLNGQSDDEAFMIQLASGINQKFSKEKPIDEIIVDQYLDFDKANIEGFLENGGVQFNNGLIVIPSASSAFHETFIVLIFKNNEVVEMKQQAYFAGDITIIK